MASLLREEISYLLARELKDPRLQGVVSITAVELSSDLGYAKIKLSVLGSEEEGREVLQGVVSAAGYVRRELGHRLKLRQIPALHFVLDPSLAGAERLDQMLARIRDGVSEA